MTAAGGAAREASSARTRAHWAWRIIFGVLHMSCEGFLTFPEKTASIPPVPFVAKQLSILPRACGAAEPDSASQRLLAGLVEAFCSP